MKACSRCRESKPPAAFHRNRARPDGLHAECKVCRRRRPSTPSTPGVVDVGRGRALRVVHHEAAGRVVLSMDGAGVAIPVAAVPALVKALSHVVPK